MDPHKRLLCCNAFISVMKAAELWNLRQSFQPSTPANNILVDLDDEGQRDLLGSVASLESGQE
jgi:hypothetical protein